MMNRKSYSSDRELIEGCIRNDRKAQRELFKRYRERVFRLIARLIREEYDRDEILQKTFISIFESLKRFKMESSLDTWIYSITTRVCMDRLRKAYRKNIISLSQEPEESMDSYMSKGKNPEEKTNNSEQIRLVYKALGRLDPEKRAIIVLYEIEGFSVDEIAGITRKPPGTIKSKLFHTRKELKNYLKLENVIRN